MKNTILLICILISIQSFAQTSLTGKVTDKETGEPILFGTVSLFKEGSLLTGTDTDLDGFYNFPNIDPGTYEVEVSYVGYSTVRMIDIKVGGGQANKADIMLGTKGEIVEDIVVVTEYRPTWTEYKGCTSPSPAERMHIHKMNLKVLADQPIKRWNYNQTLVKGKGLRERLPYRSINKTVQTMLDLQIKRL